MHIQQHPHTFSSGLTYLEHVMLCLKISQDGMQSDPVPGYSKVAPTEFNGILK